MTLPSLDTIVAYTTICFALFGAMLAALWISLVIWTFRDMRSRSRDPFAQILASLVVALLPIVGIVVYLILRPPETLAEAYERALEEEALLQEIEERPVCPGCSRIVDSDWILCAHCHTRLRKACPDCNGLLELQWTLCPYCGNRHVDPYHAHPQGTVSRPIPTKATRPIEPLAPETQPTQRLDPLVENSQSSEEQPAVKQDSEFEPPTLQSLEPEPLTEQPVEPQTFEKEPPATQFWESKIKTDQPGEPQTLESQPPEFQQDDSHSFEHSADDRAGEDGPLNEAVDDQQANPAPIE
jgi:RNA polymerase subunit RPABC4/transcription elongation factor Spt4